MFLLFGIQALGRDTIEEEGEAGDDEIDGDRTNAISRERAALEMLLNTSAAAMVALLATPLFLLYNLAAEKVSAELATAIGIGAFAFAISTLIAGLLLLLVIPTVSDDELLDPDAPTARRRRRRRRRGNRT